MNVLITGIQSHLAQLVAGALASQAGVAVVATATSTAGVSGQHLTLVEGTLRGAFLAETLARFKPDTLIHLDQPGESASGHERAGQLQTLELVATAAARGVRNIILRSSTLVYDIDGTQPAFLTEEAPLQSQAPGLTGDYLAIERFVAGFAKKTPATRIVVLRCAGMLGPALQSPLQCYLSTRPTPMALGFNPRIQAVHLNDAALAFALAALGSASGVFNIGAEPVGLLQAIQLAGSMPLALPGVIFASRLPAQLLRRRLYLPFEPNRLRYGCVADTRRSARELGWEAHYSSASAISDVFAA